MLYSFNKKIYVLLFIITFIFILMVIMQNTGIAPKRSLSKQEQNTLKQKYVEEFHGAYKEKANPNGNIKEINLVAGEYETEIFDGYKTKVWAYNGTVPGPEIRIKLGDTVRINFKNNLPQSTTIHFHGVRVPNAMDGVPGVTQPPIKPGESFVYEFTPKDPGTFWFHPHVRSSEQIERGLYGILIVEDKKDNFDFDKVLVLDDWKLDRKKQIYPYFDTPMDIMHNGRWGNVITVNGKIENFMTVTPGSTIRLRFINSSNARIYKPQIGELSGYVIAVDGMNVKKEFLMGDLDIAPGNRMDIVLKIPESFLGKDILIYDNFTSSKIPLFTLKVRGDKKSDSKNIKFALNKNIPDWSEAYKIQPDIRYVLDIRRKPGGGMMELEWTINGKAYPEYTPFIFKYNKFNVFEFRNDSNNFHPMHLHGQFFKVIARNGKPVSEPFFRDTVLVRPNETVLLATVPLDKGKWVNHCHILEHAEAGMLTVVEVK